MREARWGDIFVERNEPLGPPRADEQLRNGCAMHVLHDEQELAAIAADIQRADDVGVMDARGQSRLVEEHAYERRILGEEGMEPLDGNDAAEASGSEQPREVQARHPTFGERLEEHIAAKVDFTL